MKSLPPRLCWWTSMSGRRATTEIRPGEQEEMEGGCMFWGSLARQPTCCTVINSAFQVEWSMCFLTCPLARTCTPIYGLTNTYAQEHTHWNGRVDTVYSAELTILSTLCLCGTALLNASLRHTQIHTETRELARTGNHLYEKLHPEVIFLFFFAAPAMLKMLNAFNLRLNTSKVTALHHRLHWLNCSAGNNTIRPFDELVWVKKKKKKLIECHVVTWKKVEVD